MKAPAETPHEKFRRIAVKRTDAAIEKIRLISNLSNRSNYQYSQEEVKRIFNALKKELKLAEQAFAQGLDRGKFNL